MILLLVGFAVFVLLPLALLAAALILFAVCVWALVVGFYVAARLLVAGALALASVQGAGRRR